MKASRPGPGISLRMGLFGALGLALVLTGFILAFLLHNHLEGQFREYLSDQQLKVHLQTMESLEQSIRSQGRLDRALAQDLGRRALAQGLILRITDLENQDLWNARTEGPQESAHILDHFDSNLHGRFPSEKSTIKEQSHPVVVDGKAYGTMGILIFGPWSLEQRDLDFLSSLDSLVVLAVLTGLGPALVLALVLGGRLARRMDEILRAAEPLAQEDFRLPQWRPTVITEVRKLQEGLTEVARRLGDLDRLRRQAASDSAHEMRTPLANLLASLEALEDGVLEPSPQRLGSLTSQVRHLIELVNAWEDLDQALQRSTLAPRQAVEVPQLLETAADPFHARLKLQNQALTLTAEKGTLHTAPGILTQILSNLLENAHRYGGSGAQIHLEARRAPEAWTFLVWDNGPGIPVEHRAGVLQRFYQVDPSRPGRGLGLPLCQNLAQGLGGTLELQHPETGGLRAVVRIPLS